MLGAFSRRRSALAACGGAALQRPIELINTLLAKTRDFSSPSSAYLNIPDAELQNAAVSAIYEDVPVGSKLELKLGSQPVQVVTAIGTSHELVKLYAWTTTTAEVDKTPPLGLEYGIRKDTKSGASTIWASLIEETKSNDATTVTSPCSKIFAVVPSRYFSFDIETGGGSVDVAASKEASVVSIKTHGGAITGGALQASSLSLDSGGGAVNIKQLTASKIDIHSNGGDIAVNTLSGLNIHVDASSGGSKASNAASSAVKIGACFVEEKAEFACQKFTAESLRGGSDGSGSIHVKLVPAISTSACKSGGATLQQQDDNNTFEATVGGVDGALSISSNHGPAIIDLQINEGCRDGMIDTTPRENTAIYSASTTVKLHVAPTLAAHVILSDCGKDWMLPKDTHVVLGKDTTRNIYAQLGVEDSEQSGPRSRLQRGNSDQMTAVAGVGVMPCTLAVRGAGRVRVERRSWMQARQESFRLKRM